MFSGGSRAIFDVKFHLTFTKGKEGAEFYELTLLYDSRGPKLVRLLSSRTTTVKPPKDSENLYNVPLFVPILL